jgi:hypothetical protein
VGFGRLGGSRYGMGTTWSHLIMTRVGGNVDSRRFRSITHRRVGLWRKLGGHARMHAVFVPRKASPNFGCVVIIERAPSIGGAPLEMPLGQLTCKMSTKKTQFSQALMLYTSIVLEVSN